MPHFDVLTVHRDRYRRVSIHTDSFDSLTTPPSIYARTSSPSRPRVNRPPRTLLPSRRAKRPHARSYTTAQPLPSRCVVNNATKTRTCPIAHVMPRWPLTSSPRQHSPTSPARPQRRTDLHPPHTPSTFWAAHLSLGDVPAVHIPPRTPLNQELSRALSPDRRPLSALLGCPSTSASASIPLIDADISASPNPPFTAGPPPRLVHSVPTSPRRAPCGKNEVRTNLLPKIHGSIESPSVGRTSEGVGRSGQRLKKAS